jgi:hypothetical protein
VLRAPQVDRAQTARFVEILFRHAGEGGTVSLRTFYDEAARKDGDRPPRIRNVTLNGAGLGPLVAAAVEVAEEAARWRFAPAAGRLTVRAPASAIPTTRTRERPAGGQTGEASVITTSAPTPPQTATGAGAARCNRAVTRL